MSDTTRVLLLSTGLLPLVLLLSMLLMVEVGWRIGRFAAVRYNATIGDSGDVLIGAIFGLLALLIAFTFSGANDRFDHRRELIVREMTTIGTAYQSVDLLDAKDQPIVRDLFRRYLDHRISLYQDVLDTPALEKRMQEQSALSGQLWQAAVKAVRDTGDAEKLVAAQILPEISDMFDAQDHQRLAMKFHPPRVIWLALIFLALVGAAISGYKMGIEKSRDVVLTVVFVALMAGAIYIILNLEYPRIGSINLNEFDEELTLLRRSM